jgi:hypothetical protein
LRQLALTDPDGDMVYTGTLHVVGPSFNAFEYRYAYSSEDNTGAVSLILEDAGFDAFAYRVRYVGQDGARSFPVNPWTMPTDTWTNASVKVQEIDPYNSLTDVKDKGIVARTFSLAQNYPNPFNPSTQIRFSIPKQSLVSLKVFNILGQEVATLLNKEMNSGTYDVDFNAASLSSGIYIYTITAGSYKATKKMMLLK